VNGDVEFHLDIVISTFGGWRAQLEAPVAVHLTWQNVISTATQQNTIEAQRFYCRNTTPETAAMNKAALDL
jgi:hypothetical protein